jgi:NADPH:quinone reductase-like Zn-dependent oxidoreductase
MKAWVFHKLGRPKDVLKLETEWPVPKPTKPKQVIVKVHAVSLNRKFLIMLKIGPSLLNMFDSRRV